VEVRSQGGEDQTGRTVAGSNIDHLPGKEGLRAENRQNKSCVCLLPGGGASEVDGGGPAQQAVQKALPLLFALLALLRIVHDFAFPRNLLSVSWGQGVAFALGNRLGQKYIARPCCTIAARLEMNQ